MKSSTNNGPHHTPEPIRSVKKGDTSCRREALWDRNALSEEAVRVWLSFMIALTACSGTPGGKSQNNELSPVTAVEVAPVTRGTVSDILVTNATVESERQADIIPQTSGVVRQLLVAEGDAVQRGEVLAVLENVSLSEASQRAENELNRLRRDLAATERLYDQGAVSENELQSLKNQFQAAESSFREAWANEGNTKLVAPFDGWVASRTVKLGQLASGGSPALQVVDLERLRVVAELPERDVARVRVGQRAILVSAYDPSATASATVSRIAPIIEASTGTFRTILDLEASQKALRPGQYVTVNLEVDAHAGVIVVPKNALVYEEGQPIVYRRAPFVDDTSATDTDDGNVTSTSSSSWFGKLFGATAPKTEATDAPVDPEWMAERVGVELGLTDDSQAEITAGLAEGDIIITLGQSNLRDGAAIREVDSSAGAPSDESGGDEPPAAE